MIVEDFVTNKCKKLPTDLTGLIIDKDLLIFIKMRNKLK